jgi:hypothetical protein
MENSKIMASLSKELVSSSSPLRNNTFVSGMFLKERPIGTTRPPSIPSLYSNNDRGNNPQSSWSSSDYWTSFYTYLNSGNDCERAAFMAVGDYHFSGGTNFTYNSKSYGGGRLEFSKQNRVGHTVGTHLTSNNNTSYGPFGSRVMFVKNRGTAAIGVNFYFQAAVYWSSGHDGMGLWIGEPNTSGYSGVTSLAWTRLGIYQSSNWQQTMTGSFTLQPGRTYVVLGCNTFQYWTSFPSGGHWNSGSQFYGLDTTFSNSNIVPDLKLTHTAMVAGDWNRFTNSAGNQFFQHWPLCGELFGENSNSGEIIW